MWAWTGAVVEVALSMLHNLAQCHKFEVLLSVQMDKLDAINNTTVTFLLQ